MIAFSSVFVGMASAVLSSRATRDRERRSRARSESPLRARVLVEIGKCTLSQSRTHSAGAVLSWGCFQSHSLGNPLSLLTTHIAHLSTTLDYPLDIRASQNPTHRHNNRSSDGQLSAQQALLLHTHTYKEKAAKPSPALAPPRGPDGLGPTAALRSQLFCFLAATGCTKSKPSGISSLSNTSDDTILLERSVSGISGTAGCLQCCINCER